MLHNQHKYNHVMHLTKTYSENVISFKFSRNILNITERKTVDKRLNLRWSAPENIAGAKRLDGGMHERKRKSGKKRAELGEPPS